LQWHATLPHFTSMRSTRKHYSSSYRLQSTGLPAEVSMVGQRFVWHSLPSLGRLGYCSSSGLLLLIIPLVELLARRPKHLVLHLVGILTIGSLGVGLYALYLWGVHGSPIAFAQAQSEWGGSWVIPGTGFITSMQVTLGLAGEPADWFTRVVSLHDWVSSLLFLILTVVAYRWVRHSLFLYMFAGMLLLLVRDAAVIGLTRPL